MGFIKVHEWNAMRDRAFTNWNKQGHQPATPSSLPPETEPQTPEPENRRDKNRERDEQRRAR